MVLVKMNYPDGPRREERGLGAIPASTCPAGCGCRMGTTDAESNECACGGACQYQ